MSTFVGRVDVRIDAKGRVFVPAAYRKLLCSESMEMEGVVLVVRKDPYAACLEFFSEEAWVKQEADVNDRLDDWDPIDKQLKRQFLAEVEYLTMDKQGRVLISKRFMEMISLKVEAVWIGQSKGFSLWAREVYEEGRIAVDEFARLMQERMAKKRLVDNK